MWFHTLNFIPITSRDEIILFTKTFQIWFMCSLLSTKCVVFSSLKTICIFLSKGNSDWHLDKQIQFESRIFFQDEWSVHLMTSFLTTSFPEEKQNSHWLDRVPFSHVISISNICIHTIFLSNVRQREHCT